MNISAIREKITRMPREERNELEANAKRILMRDANNSDARSILDVLRRFKGDRRIQVEPISWEPHDIESRGYDGERQVASIIKLDNHRHKSVNKDVYELRVLGKRVDTLRYIGDARQKAAEIYSAKR